MKRKTRIRTLFQKLAALLKRHQELVFENRDKKRMDLVALRIKRLTKRLEDAA